MREDRKEPLYRKVNTKARGCWHDTGSEARYDRNTKEGISKKMSKDRKRGLDYTPLFRFLLSRIGKKWDEVYSEAKSRLDREEPIFWMVKLYEEVPPPMLNVMTELHKKLHFGSFRTENSTFSKLIVDENGLLQLKDSTLKNEDFSPSCPCCTHTFNGKPLIKKFKH